MAEYIEKQAALDIVNGWRDQLIPTYGENDEYVKCLETVAEHLESLHPADVRPVVRGEWKKKRTPYDDHIFICTACLNQISVLGNPLAFCPNCGADMKGGDNDG